MKLNCFSVFDTKAQAYGVPFFMPTVGSAIRAFTDLVNDNRSAVNRHPSDYLLFHIGDFDDSTSVLVSFTQPIALGMGSDYVELTKGPVFQDPMLSPKKVIEKEIVK